MEPHARALLELVAADGDHQRDFEKCFIELLDQPELGPFELIEFCMHRLRWPAVRSEVALQLEKAKDEDDWRSIPVLLSILDSFTDEWEGRDLWESYSEGSDS